MKVDISIGELIDKVTILSIKMEKIKDENKIRGLDSKLVCLGETNSGAINTIWCFRYGPGDLIPGQYILVDKE